MKYGLTNVDDDHLSRPNSPEQLLPFALNVNLDTSQETKYEIRMGFIRDIISTLNDCSYLINATICKDEKRLETASLIVKTIMNHIRKLYNLPVRSRMIKQERQPNRTLLDDCKNDSIVFVNREERIAIINNLRNNQKTLETNPDTMDKNKKLTLLINTNQTTGLLLDLPIKKFISENFSENEAINSGTSSLNDIQDDQNLSRSDDKDAEINTIANEHIISESKIDKVLKENEIGSEIEETEQENSDDLEAYNIKQTDIIDDLEIDTIRNNMNDLEMSEISGNENGELDANTILKSNELNEIKKEIISNSAKINDSQNNSEIELIDLTDEINEMEISNEHVRDPLNPNFSAQHSDTFDVSKISITPEKRPNTIEIDLDSDSVQEIEYEKTENRFRFEFKKMRRLFNCINFKKNGKFENGDYFKKRSESFVCLNNTWFLRVYILTRKGRKNRYKYVKIGLVREQSIKGKTKADKISVDFDLKLLNYSKRGQDRVEEFKMATFEGERATCWCNENFVSYPDLEKFIKDDAIFIDICIKSVFYNNQE